MNEEIKRTNSNGRITADHLESAWGAEPQLCEEDFGRAKIAFEKYLDGYDRDDPQIRLKEIHTYGVVRCAEEIARRLGLSEEDTVLAKVIALLHDIGRFEQVRLYSSFRPGTMDHAVFGVKYLFGDKAGENDDINDSTTVGSDESDVDGKQHIRDFIKPDCFDKVIRLSILYHNRFALPEITDERLLLQARLIRDADKLDNCRVKLTEAPENMIGMDTEEIENSSISPAVWESCLRHETVLSSDRKTGADYWVSYLAHYFDLNFDVSRDIMKENRYIERIAGRFDFKLPDTREKINSLVDMLT